ncbi:hypothetical protein [Aeoliella sp.]|uniref:hypothetical protein n=1 Tax=Aeoliella sp. TaxID=2795800 RepID=UPI003CCBB637
MLNKTAAFKTVLCIAMLLPALLATRQACAETSYGQAYQKMWGNTPGVGYGTNRYLYDKYYRSNPNVSPYVSGAVLGGNLSGNAYTAVVRPEQQARARTASAQSNYVQQRKLQGNVGYTANPGATVYNLDPGVTTGKPVPAGRRNSGAYQNHWYGSWNK